jgi:hypothetical protein
MRKIQITLEIDDEDLHAYQFEAEREGTSVEKLVEQMVQGLYREFKREEQEADHEILFP